MNLSSLTKEQKQYIVLGVIVSVAAVVLAVFGIKISLRTISTAKAELADLTEKIEKADRALSKREATNAEYLKSAADLKLLLSNVPPARNYYSWATEVIYSQAHDAELDIDAIDELSRSPAVAKGAAAATGVQLDSYALRISAHGGYHNVLRFLAMLKERHPMARMTGLEISAGTRKDAHSVQFVIQWPFAPDAIVAAWEAIAAKQKPDDQKTVAPQAEPKPEPVANPEARALPVVQETAPAPAAAPSGPTPTNGPTPPKEIRPTPKPVEVPPSAQKDPIQAVVEKPIAVPVPERPVEAVAAVTNIEPAVVEVEQDEGVLVHPETPADLPDAGSSLTVKEAADNLLDDLLATMTKSVLEPMDEPTSGNGADTNGISASGLAESKKADAKNELAKPESGVIVPME